LLRIKRLTSLFRPTTALRLGTDQAIAAIASEPDLGQSKEPADHQRLTLATEVEVYFYDPRSPWQRGSNENTNAVNAPCASAHTAHARTGLEMFLSCGSPRSLARFSEFFDFQLLLGVGQLR
jgi:hypothetical protein